MNKLTKILLATGAAAMCGTFQSPAEFTGYWKIGATSPGDQPSVTHNTSSVTALGPQLSADPEFPYWQFQTAGTSLGTLLPPPAGYTGPNGQGEFQRSPLQLGSLATGFSLTAYARSAAYLWIEAPTGPSDPAPNEWFSHYLFSFNININAAGVIAGYWDKNGVHTFASGLGLHAQENLPWDVQIEATGSSYGWFIINDSDRPIQTLQIQGLVPEPSSIAMGSMVGLAALGYGIRRWKASKA